MGNCFGLFQARRPSKPSEPLVVPSVVPQEPPKVEEEAPLADERYEVPLVERGIHPLLLSALCGLEINVNGKATLLGDMTTGDVVRHFVKPETAGQFGSLVNCVAAIVGGLWETEPIPPILLKLVEKYRQAAGGPKPFHGHATFFVSHAWSYKLSELRQILIQHYESMCGSEFKWFPLFYWIDIMAVNQNFSGDFSTNPDGNFPSVIRECTGVVFTIHPWTAPIAPRRIWCLFEALTALELGIELELVLDPKFREQTAPLDALEQRFREQVVRGLDVGQAQATVEDDRVYIRSLLEKRPGGIPQFNQMMREMLAQRMLEVLLLRAVVGQNVAGGQKIVDLGARITRQHLKFKYARVTDTSLEILSPALRGCQALHTLDLTSVGDRGLITSRGLGHLAAGLAGNTTLQALVLSNNQSIGEAGMQALCSSVLRSHPSLTRLHLRKTGLDDEGAGALAEALAANTVLQHLDLSLNDDLGDAGVITLLKALAVSPSLVSVDLSYLALDSRKVCKELAAMVASNSTLEALTLRCCSLKSEGVEKVCSALHKNIAVRCLDLSNNSIGDEEGCAALAGLLAHNLFLEELRLVACGVTEAGAKTLRDALAKNKSLNHLALAENKVTGAQWEALLRRHGPVTAEVDFLPPSKLPGSSSLSMSATGSTRRALSTGQAQSGFLGTFASTTGAQGGVGGTSFAAAFGAQSYPLLMATTGGKARSGVQSSGNSGVGAGKGHVAASVTGISMQVSGASTSTVKSSGLSVATSRHVSETAGAGGQGMLVVATVKATDSPKQAVPAVAGLGGALMTKPMTKSGRGGPR